MYARMTAETNGLLALFRYQKQCFIVSIKNPLQTCSHGTLSHCVTLINTSEPTQEASAVNSGKSLRHNRVHESGARCWLRERSRVRFRLLSHPFGKRLLNGAPVLKSTRRDCYHKDASYSGKFKIQNC